MPVYCGVDFHARQQTVCYCDSADGTLHRRELDHRKDEVLNFYSQLKGEVIVGLEASGYSTWFIELLERFGHQVFIGDAAEIRRVARKLLIRGYVLLRDRIDYTEFLSRGVEARLARLAT